MTPTATRQSTWEHLEYGKLVQSPGGPIVPGSEHGFTGRSAAFPMELTAACHPSRLGLGERDSRRWAQCPWAATGGIVSGTGHVGGRPWVLCARQRERSEGGEGVEGRLYTEAHYAAIEAESYEFDSLLRLAPTLRAEPRESFDMTLPALVVVDEQADEPLPDGWLNDIRLILRGVMSGVPVNIQDWETLPENFLGIATRCLAAMPPSLRWRMPVGAGLMTMDQATAFASGMSALGGIRVIGGAVKNEDAFDLSLGSSYLEWLEQISTDCRTARALAEMVARELPRHASVDAIDVRTEWPTAAKTVSTTVVERRRLTRVLDAMDVGDDAASMGGFTEFRDDVLIELCARASGPHSALVMAQLADSIAEGWIPAWDAILSRGTPEQRRERLALAVLLGIRPPDDPTVLLDAAAVDVQGRARDEVVERLAAAVLATGHAEGWRRLAELRGANVAPWVALWRARASANLIWLGVREAVRAGRRSLLLTMKDHPLAQAAEDLIRGDDADPGSIELLFAAAAVADGQPGSPSPDDAPTIDHLIKAAGGKGNAWQAYRLAELGMQRGIETSLSRLVEGTSSKTRAARGSPTSAELVDTLAREVTKDHLPIGPLMLRSLLAHRVALASPARGKAIQQLLKDRIGDPYVTALFGHEPLSRLGEDRDAAHAYCLADIDDETAENLIGELPQFSGEVKERTADLLKHWVSRPAQPGTADSKRPLARAVRTLAGADSANDHMLPQRDRPAVRAAVIAIGLSPEKMWQTAREESLLDIVSDVWPRQRPMPLREDQLHVVLETVLDDRDSMERWKNRIAARGWDRDIGWRWVVGEARECTPLEREAVAALDKPDQVMLILAGLPVPADVAARIDAEQVEAALARRRASSAGDSPVRDLATLLRYASNPQSPGLIRAVARIALQLARDSGLAKLKVVAGLEADSGLGRALIEKFRPPQTPLELFRQAARALHEEPRDLVDTYWEQTRKRRSGRS